MLENFDKYQIHPVQRTKTVFSVNPDLNALIRRRPVEVLRSIDERGNWAFGVELRQINTLTLAKLRVMGQDGTNVSVQSVSMGNFPHQMEVRFTRDELNPDGEGKVIVCFDDRYELELCGQNIALMEFHTYFPNEQEMVSPWIGLALTA